MILPIIPFPLLSSGSLSEQEPLLSSDLLPEQDDRRRSRMWPIKEPLFSSDSLPEPEPLTFLDTCMSSHTRIQQGSFVSTYILLPVSGRLCISASLCMYILVSQSCWNTEPSTHKLVCVCVCVCVCRVCIEEEYKRIYTCFLVVHVLHTSKSHVSHRSRVLYA